MKKLRTLGTEASPELWRLWTFTAIEIHRKFLIKMHFEVYFKIILPRRLAKTLLRAEKGFTVNFHSAQVCNYVCGNYSLAFKARETFHHKALIGAVFLNLDSFAATLKASRNILSQNFYKLKYFKQCKLGIPEFNFEFLEIMLETTSHKVPQHKHYETLH